MLKEKLEQVRAINPLVHNITNYVTVNDCANLLLACGASPVMADDAAEVAEIASISAAVNINIGTLNQNTIPSMFAAGKEANRCGRPVVLDPVGAGASFLRTETACKLLKEVQFAAIKGNVSEIKALALGTCDTKGVDASLSDAVTAQTLEDTLQFAKRFSAQTNAVIVLTGAVDLVTDANRSYVIRNGHPMMSKITGSGCMLSAMMAAYLGANVESPLDAAAAAVCAMGLCGETAHARLSPADGNASYRTYLIDAVYCLCGDDLERGAKYEVR